MTASEHCAKAEEHLAAAAAIETDGHEDSMSAWHQRQAQAHATLALAAVAADVIARGSTQEGREWREVMFP